MTKPKSKGDNTGARRIWGSTLITNGIIVGSGILGGILLARLLGVEDRGLLAAILYWPHFVAGIACMGVNEGIVVQLAKSREQKLLTPTVLMISIVIAIIAGIIGVALMPHLLGPGRAEHLAFSRGYYMVFIPFTLLAMNFLALDQGSFNYSDFNSQRIVQAIIYPVLLGGFWLWGGLNVQTAAISVLGGTVLVALLRFWKRRSEFSSLPSINRAKQLVVFSFRIHLVNIVTALASQIDRMILVFFSTNVKLGLYVIAITASSVLPSLLVQTFINIMLPEAAKLGLDQKNQRLAVMPLVKLLFILGGCSVGLAFMIPQLIVIVYGEEFCPSGPLARILVFAFFFVGVKQAIIYLLRSWELNLPGLYGEGVTALVLLTLAYSSLQVGDVIGLCWLMLAAHILGTVTIVYHFISRLCLRKYSKLPDYNRPE